MMTDEPRKEQITRRQFIGTARSWAAFTIVPRHVLGGSGRHLRFTNNEKANEYVRPRFRKGWELEDIII